MKHKYIAALCAAALALALLAGCGSAPSSAPAPGSDSGAASAASGSAPESSTPSDEYVPDWRVEPYLEAAQIVGLPEDAEEMDQQNVFTHLGIQQAEGGGWQFLNFETGKIFPDQQSTQGVWGTFNGSLAFFEGGNFDFGMEYEQLAAWVAQLSAEQGIGLDYMGHGGISNYPPVLVDGEWLQYFTFPEGLSTFDETMPLEFSGPANVALILDVHNENWQMGSGDIPWMYVGTGEVRYDGVILVDQNGESISDIIFEDGMPYREGVAAVKLDGKWGYVDETGAPITEFVYEPMISNNVFLRDLTVPYSANEGLIPVKRDGKCGVIDTSGREVVPCIFDGITSVYDGAVWAQQDGKWGVLNVA